MPAHATGPINVVLIAPDDAERIERVRAVAPDRLHVTSITAPEIAADGGSLWPPRDASIGHGVAGREQRDALLRDAHVILLGLPYPTTLHTRTRNLAWVHHPYAGASNLRDSDLWGAPVVVTTSRGANAALPIAETAVAGAVMFAKGLHLAARGSLDRRDYLGNVALTGKTMGVLGLGGIGGHVARLAKGLGMRVVATRRSAAARQNGVEGVDELFPPHELHAMLARCDYLAVCAMLTPETEGMLDAGAFAALKHGAVLLNVARGEIVEEQAMLASLDSGRLRGAYLDVFAGELSGAQPPPALRDHPHVVLTPHVSGHADHPGPLGFDAFLDNLRRFVAGAPLHNVVDWERGY